jgi:hypothetical protein
MSQGWIVAALVLAGGMRGAQAQAAPAETGFLPVPQDVDGHWPALGLGSESAADLRVSAWIILSILGDGSTLKSGPHRSALCASVRWLQRQQDAAGRLGLRADADWLLDHAMATYALCEAIQGLRPPKASAPALAAAAALQREVARARPAPGVEVRLWCRMVAQSLRFRARSDRDQSDPPLTEDEREGVAARERAGTTLRELVDRMPRLPPPAADAPARERAAQLLCDSIAGCPQPTGAMPACWPADPVAEPMAAFYTLSATFVSDPKAYLKLSKLLSRSLVRQRVGHGEHQGTFAPLGAFGSANGRTGTSALCVLQLEIYYRYCRLSICQGG